SGAYTIDELVPAPYRIVASAAGHQPAVWRDAQQHEPLRLGAGEQRTGVDLALATGGVAVHGVGSDINGGRLAGAPGTTVRPDDWSRALTGGAVRSGPDGPFTVWTAPGETVVQATADGYHPNSRYVIAPGAFAEVLLTPECVLAGTVVRAGSRAPVANAMVMVAGEEGAWARTAQQG